jgi:hypothetical protein
VDVACPTCTRLNRDEAILRDAVQERTEALRFELPEDVRAEVEAEERLLAALLARIEERRAPHQLPLACHRAQPDPSEALAIGPEPTRVGVRGDKPPRRNERQVMRRITALVATLALLGLAGTASADQGGTPSCDGAVHGAFANVNRNFGFLGEEGGTPGYHNGATGQDTGATGYNNSTASQTCKG